METNRRIRWAFPPCRCVSRNRFRRIRADAYKRRRAGSVAVAGAPSMHGILRPSIRDQIGTGRAVGYAGHWKGGRARRHHIVLRGAVGLERLAFQAGVWGFERAAVEARRKGAVVDLSAGI